MKGRHPRILLLGLLWGLTLALHAASAPARGGGRVSFREYTTEDGVPDHAIQVIPQSPDQFMWFIAEGGVIRYDGTRFRYFSQPEGLEDGMLLRGTFDGAGRLHVTGLSGLHRLHQGRFQSHKPLADTVLARLGPWKDGALVCVDSTGTLLAGSFERGFTAMSYPEPRGISALWSSGEGTLWIAQGTILNQRLPEGTWRAWGPAEGLVFGTDQARSGTPDKILALVQTPEGTVWARSRRHLFRLAPGSGRWEDLGDQVPATATGRMSPGTGDRLWIHTDEGLRLYTKGTWFSLGSREGLSPLPTIFGEDREGSLWVFAGALKRLEGQGALERFQETEGLPNAQTWSLLEDRGGQLWAGTIQGLARLGPQGRWQSVPAIPKELVTALTQDAKGTLYAASDSGLFVQRPGEGGFRRWDVQVPFADSVIHVLHQDRRGRWWFGTEDAGLWEASLHNGAFRFRRHAADAGPEFVSALGEDATGRIWVATSSGLSILDGEAWHRFSGTDGLPRDGIGSLVLGTDGTFLCSGMTGGQLVEGRFEQGRLDMIRTSATYPGHILSLLRGRDGALWVGTSTGVFRSIGGRTTHFGTGEGLVGDDLIANRILEDRDGHVWIATSNGLSRFHADRWQDPAPPEVYLSHLRFGRQERNPDGPLRVAYRERRLEVHFSPLTFLNEKNVDVRSRLLGQEEDWEPVEGRWLLHGNLDPGTYHLELQARIRQQPWGPVRRVSFEILPPWWQTWWFRGLVLLSGSTVIVMLYRWRTRTIRQRATELESQVRQRTEELAKALGELSEANAHLVTLSTSDPLTGLQNRRYFTSIIDRDVAQARRAYRGVQETGGRGAMPAQADLLFLLVDLDHFKRINDTYGHAAGDRILVETRNRLLLCVREVDSVVRWGGEEFLVLARSTHREEAPIIAERIRSTLAATPFDLGEGRHTPMTCSVGWACLPFFPGFPERLGWEQVLDLADQALYAAKLTSRNAWIGVAGHPGLEADPTPPEGSRLPELVEAGWVQVYASQPHQGILWMKDGHI